LFLGLQSVYKLPYFQICGKKVGKPYKNGVIVNEPFDIFQSACRTYSMKSNGTQPVCKRGVCTAEKCFCPDNLIRKKYTWGEECISANDLVDQNAQNKSFNGLYGVDVDGDIYYASYDLDNNIVENATSFGDKMPFRLGFITNLRYDFYDNSLIINDRYEGKLNTDPRKMILQFHLKNDPTN